MKKYFVLFLLSFLIFANSVNADTKATSTSSTNTNIIKDQVDKATSSINDIILNSVNIPAVEKVGVIDNFRINTLSKISVSKTETKTKIDEFKKLDANNLKKTTTESNKVGVEDATERPIAYLKIFFLSILSFVFGSQVVFYLVSIFVLYLILRTIYRKIRNK